MFKIGDEVICIDGSFDDSVTNFGNHSNLTCHKVYEVVNCFPSWEGIRVVNDENKPRDYFSERFMLLSEYRTKKLKKICTKLGI